MLHYTKNMLYYIKNMLYYTKNLLYDTKKLLHDIKIILYCMEAGAEDKFKNSMVRLTFGAFLPWAPCCFCRYLQWDLCVFVLFAVEQSDLVGGPRGAEPP